jgi:hypothetical protein
MGGPRTPFDPPAYPQNDPFAGHGPGSGSPFYHQQPPAYLDGQSLPPYQPPIARPPERDYIQWVIAGIAAAIIFTVVAGALVYSQFRSHTSGDDQASQASTTVAPSTSASAISTPPTAPAAPAPSAAPTAGTCNGRSASRGPQTPAGWSSVISPRGLVYDVPPGWTVNSCTTLVGWERPCPDGPFGFCPIRTMSGSANLDNPACKKDDLALSGVPGAKDIPDINQAVRAEADLVKAIYTSDKGQLPTVDIGTPRTLTVGGRPAVELVATVTNIGAGKCSAPTGARHVMVATTVPGQPGSVLFVVALELGVAGAPAPDLADQMVASLRDTA